MKRFFLLLLISVQVFSFTKKEYSNYNTQGVRYFLNGLYYEQSGSAERAEENFQIAYLKTNSEAVKFNLAVRNILSGKKDEGYSMLKELYDSGYNLGKFGIYLYLSLEPGRYEADFVLDRIISDLDKLGETTTASAVIKQKLSDKVYSFTDADGFLDFVNDIYPEEPDRNNDYFFSSIIFMVQSRLKKNTAEMDRILDELEEKYRDLPYSFYSMAFYEYNDLGESGKAGDILRKMNRYNYGEAGYYYDNAEYLAENSEYARAVNMLLDGIRKFPESSLDLRLASLYLTGKDTVNAGIIYDRIINGNPESDFIYELIANEYSKAGYEGLSIKLYENSLKKLPDDPEILNNYSYILAVKGIELDKALEMVDKALSMRQESITFLDTKAWVLFRLGRIEEAEKIMDGIFSSDESFYHQSSEELFDHYTEIKKALNKTDQINDMSLNKTALVLSEIIARSSYLLEMGF